MMLGCLVMRSSETSALADPAIANAKSAVAVSSAVFILFVGVVIWEPLLENQA
jgi:hypothetical protein